ncbi:hypothetical protein [Dictyobacter kobayashii]|uniref:Glycosyltransferase RgtA/B/C/D-like domain-containing protein n=1 Tax=Dictyobacter kobayashii TaxID=2014872 RepID=A0A402AWH7_9CHLR|nr:hypothetical protein [Dictyobacter kobayashii]GCE23438.1 hypothetical protein KDK_72380 [Dictyobacter kobayashii]
MKLLTTYLVLVYTRCLPICPRPLQRLIYVIDRRACDPDAEKYFRRVRDLAIAWPLLLRNACGLFLLYASLLGVSAYGFAFSLHGGPGLERYFFPALAVMFFCSAWRLIWPATSRAERIVLLCLLGSSCYLLKIMISPLHFSFADEILHWNTTNALLKTGQLFQDHRPIPVSPYYAGLEIVTAAFSSLSGLSSFTSGLVVIGCSRLVLILSLFLLNEQLFKSSRIASLATLFYMANPHFFFFDAQYGSESLALPLITLILWLLESHQILSAAGLEPSKISRSNVALLVSYRKDLRQRLTGIVVLTILLLLGLTFTHYASDFFLIIFLFIWTLEYSWQHPGAIWRSSLLYIVLIAIILALINAFLVMNPVRGGLFSLSGGTAHRLVVIVQGAGKTQPLFVGYSGRLPPPWLRFLPFAAQFLIMGCFPFGLFCLLKRHNQQALGRAFGWAALCYLLSQMLHFIGSSSELTDQAMAFLFIPVASLLALATVQLLPIHRLSKLQITGMAALIMLILLGGALSEWINPILQGHF